MQISNFAVRFELSRTPTLRNNPSPEREEFLSTLRIPLEHHASAVSCGGVVRFHPSSSVDVSRPQRRTPRKRNSLQSSSRSNGREPGFKVMKMVESEFLRRFPAKVYSRPRATSYVQASGASAIFWAFGTLSSALVACVQPSKRGIFLSRSGNAHAFSLVSPVPSRTERLR